MKKTTLWGSLTTAVVSIILCCIMVIPVMAAADDLDGLTGGDTTTTQADAGALGDYLKGYQPIDDGNMKEAQSVAKPLTNLIGNAVGVIVLLVGAGIFFVTACDLAYIAIPFTRPLLTSRYQIVSDEAIQTVQGGMQGGMNGMQGGMGSPMGSMGGMYGGGMGSPMGGMASPMGSPMGGMNGMNGMNGGQMSVKSAISQYFKKRTVFIVIFTIAAILLTSSALTGVGVNLAALLFKVIDKFNRIINGVNM